MNRRWQGEGKGRYESLMSFKLFSDSVPKLQEDLKISDVADLYATYSHLHSKGKASKIKIAFHGTFHYFLTETEGNSSQFGAGKVQLVSASQGTCGGGEHSEPTQSSENVQMVENSLVSLSKETDVWLKAAEPVVPVGSKASLSVELLKRLFILGDNFETPQIVLAIVDDDGSVSMLRLHNSIF
jgi:hypothetical protein